MKTTIKQIEAKKLTAKNDTLRKGVTLDTPLSSLLVVNWEMVLYATLFIIALVTRFYDLGTRVMSHDESLHTLYSWNLYAGKGYQHDPLMHGPFLFHFNALIYFLFGDNDFTARISTALFGAVLVILPYWFRPWLGRLGALAAAFMILISPGLLYYSRYIRHDIFISVWTGVDAVFPSPQMDALSMTVDMLNAFWTSLSLDLPFRRSSSILTRL